MAAANGLRLREIGGAAAVGFALALYQFNPRPVSELPISLPDAFALPYSDEMILCAMAWSAAAALGVVFYDLYAEHQAMAILPGISTSEEERQRNA